MAETKHFADKNGTYIGGFGDGAEPPEGVIQVPAPPDAYHTWDGSEWVPPAPTIEQLRANASLSRSRFILAALDAGILSETDAEQAVNGWPSGWDAFFDDQPARDRIAAKAEWASITTVRRDAPLIEQLRIFKGLTEEQIDQLFGIV